MSGAGSTRRSCTALTTPACSTYPGPCSTSARVRAKGGRTHRRESRGPGQAGFRCTSCRTLTDCPLLVGISAANTHDSLEPMVQGPQTRHDPHRGPCPGGPATASSTTATNAPATTWPSSASPNPSLLQTTPPTRHIGHGLRDGWIARGPTIRRVRWGGRSPGKSATNGGQ